MEPAGRKVFVTGATGLIGSGICTRLMDQGASVVGLVRSPDRARDLAARGIVLLPGDLSRSDGDLAAGMQDCDVVIHCAGVMGPDFVKRRGYFRTVNVDGTRRVAEAALANGVKRFVYVSTAWVYGFDAGPGTDETSARHPSDDSYCDTKLETEDMVRELMVTRGLPGVIVQPAEVYGPGDRSWTLMPLKMLKKGMMMLPGGGAGLVQPIFVDDAVEGILLAAERGTIGEAYLLAGPEVVTVKEFFSYYADMIGKKRMPSVPAGAAQGLAVLLTAFARLSRTPALLNPTTVRGLCLQATYDGEKARRDLGFEARTDLATGMRAVKRWLDEADVLD